MGSLKEEAIKYEPSTTKIVSDLEVFDINMNLETFEGTDNEGKKFAYKYIMDKENVRYSVPWCVIAQIKAYLEENDKLTLFKVKKNGEGLKTTYMVIPKTK
jgi:hypothetical protein